MSSDTTARSGPPGAGPFPHRPRDLDRGHRSRHDRQPLPGRSRAMEGAPKPV